MRASYRRYARKGFIFLALLVLAGWLAPSFFSAERYRRRLSAGLERALQRPVSFASIRFHLLPRPGFSIANAIVQETPAFGSEPFVYIERVACDLRWRSLWRSQLECARLRLVRPSFNIVRNARGEWNVEDLLQKSVIAAPAEPASEATGPGGQLGLDLDQARINFKSGEDKKPFAITDVSGGLVFDSSHHSLRFRLTGSPIRTDRSLPSPGVVELSGEWKPGKGLEGPLDATLRTRGASLYGWVPLVTGHNPEIYGLLDADFRLTGSIRLLKIQGESRISQLHRWESLPPSDPMPCSLNFRGQFDRRSGRAVLEGLDALFGGSHLHVAGAVERIPAGPELDLVVAIERSRLEDLLALGRRLWGDWGQFGVSGRVDGLLTIQGPWRARRYGGFLGLRNGRLRTSSGTFPISEVALRINNQGARMAPARLSLAPRVELVLEGWLQRPLSGSRRHREPPTPHYELLVSAEGLPLKDLVLFVRGVGVRALPGLDAQGSGTVRFRLAGLAWPPARPTLSGHAELRAAQLLVPGLTEPLNIPRARIQLNGTRVVADPIVAVMGTSVFTARLEHQGERRQPWEFDVRANSLSIEQGALWFDVLGHRRPSSLLERLPGLSSLAARRVAASNLFGLLNAKGRFATPAVTYRTLTLRDFKASAEVSGRKIRIEAATFRTGGGNGQGHLELDLSEVPGRVAANLTLAAVNLQSLAPRLPPALAKLRGSLSGAGHFETRGLSRQEMTTALQGQATVHLKNMFFGDFDPLQALASAVGWGTLESAHGETVVRSTALALQVLDRRLLIGSQGLDLAGAKLLLNGTYTFDGAVDLDIQADFRHLARRRLDNVDKDEKDPDDSLLHLHLVGPIDRLGIAQTAQVARTNR